MTDVRIFQTPDGGDIRIENGLFELSDGLEQAVYLSLFGGNEEDSGLQGDDSKQWWGNLTETEPARRYRSETQFLFRSIPAIPANLRRIEDAVGRDLAWMADEVAQGVSIVASMPGVNQVHIDISVTVQSGTGYQFGFSSVWGPQQ